LNWKETLMKTITVITLALLVIMLSAICDGETGPKKKVIHWGWGTPTPAFLKQNIGEMEKIPFDGVTIDVPVTAPGDEVLGKSMFYPRAWFRPWMLESQLKALQQTQFKRFANNFLALRTSTSPEMVDWFDDYRSVINNFKVAAGFAREAGLKGFIIDVEHYGYCRMFSFKDRKFPEKTWTEYEAQVFKVGREIMQAINSQYPDITILFPFTYRLVYDEHTRDKSGLPSKGYGLVPAFMDGLVAGASPDTELIDVYEHSYRYSTEKQFASARQSRVNAIKTLAADPEKALAKFSFGFGIWPQPGDTPDEWQHRLSLALKYTDEYVWVYTEYLNYWGTAYPYGTSDGFPGGVPMPKRMIESQRKAHQ